MWFFGEIDLLLENGNWLCDPIRNSIYKNLDSKIRTAMQVFLFRTYRYQDFYWVDAFVNSRLWPGTPQFWLAESHLYRLSISYYTYKSSASHFHFTRAWFPKTSDVNSKLLIFFAKIFFFLFFFVHWQLLSAASILQQMMELVIWWQSWRNRKSLIMQPTMKQLINKFQGIKIRINFS